MPRAAAASIHARVEGTEPATWEDPSLVQIWGPRFSVFVVPARDLAVFTLGTLPDDARGRKRAQDLGARLAAFLGGTRMTYAEAGRGLGVHPNSLRYAAATGTVLIRWDGARSSTVWTVPPPEVDPGDARLELARRYLHIYGPAGPESFGRWAGLGMRHAVAAFQALRGSLTTVRTPIGEASILTRDEAAFRKAPGPAGPGGPGAAAAERRRLPAAAGNRSRAPRPQRRSPRRAVDPARLARWRSHRRRSGRDLAARGHGDDGAAVAAAIARRTRRGRCGGADAADTRHPGAHRAALGRPQLAERSTMPRPDSGAAEQRP
jgi:hypothetical protein